MADQAQGGGGEASLPVPPSKGVVASPRAAFNKADEAQLAELYTLNVKLLDKAGLNEKCTPKVLRQKLANDMGLGQHGLNGCESVLSKMIIRWWKASGEKQHTTKLEKEAAGVGKSKESKEAKPEKVAVKTEKPAAAPSSSKYSKETYQKMRQLVKDIDKSKLLEGISDLPDNETKMKSLRKRMLEALGVDTVLSDPPTDKEMESVREAHKKSMDSIGIDKANIVAGKRGEQEQREESSAKKVKTSHGGDTNEAQL